MKKIMTLLFVLGAAIVVNAQPPHPYGDARYESTTRYQYGFSARDRDEQIERINHEYDSREGKVAHNFWKGRREKDFEISRLEDQRRDEIRQVWERFRNSNHSYSDDRYPRNDRRW